MQRKLKVGCLHGYGTNAKFMKRQMRSFIRTFEDKFEFIFLEGPFIAPKQFILDDKVLNMIEGETRSWSGTKNVRYQQEEYMKEVQGKIKETLQSSSDHYDAFIGFSMGGVFLHWLLKLLQDKTVSVKGTDDLKFAIFICSNHWSWRDLNLARPITLPTVHLVSQSDFLFKNSLFKTVQFQNPLVVFHNAGHAFPRFGREERERILDYIKQSKNRKTVSLKNSHL